MVLYLGDQFPDFTANSTLGKISMHDYIGNNWCVLFSHPSAFTPVCTTELAKTALLAHEFDKRNVKVIALSCNDVETQRLWVKDIESFGKLSTGFHIPIIEDKDKKISKLLKMIPESFKDVEGIPLSTRTVFVIGPDKKLKLVLMYPYNVGRNTSEILRCIDALQLAENYRVATPADWKHGDNFLVSELLKPEQIQEIFPSGYEVYNVPSGKDYLKVIKSENLKKTEP